MPCLLACWIVAATSVAAVAAEPPPASPDVAATVGDEPIAVEEAARLLEKATGGQPVNPAAKPVLQAQVLEELVARRLVLAYAKREGDAPAPAAIDAEMAKLRTRLDGEGKSLAEYLRRESIDEAGLRRQLAWNLVWEKYLARYVTDQRQQSHFAAHRREFDGTELEVRHIVLRPETATPEAVSAAVKRAGAMRDEIAAGRVSFAEAAKKHSAGPSSADGGRLGFIPRHGLMEEPFSRAAFALKPGEVSPPVVTSVGVHLIRCDGEKPGGRTWSEVRKPLEESLARELLDKLSQLERKRTPVRYTGAWPHFDPATGKPVEP